MDLITPILVVYVPWSSEMFGIVRVTGQLSRVGRQPTSLRRRHLTDLTRQLSQRAEARPTGQNETCPVPLAWEQPGEMRRG